MRLRTCWIGFLILLVVGTVGCRMGYDRGEQIVPDLPIFLEAEPASSSHGPLALGAGEDGFGVVWLDATEAKTTETQEVYYRALDRLGQPLTDAILLSEADGYGAKFPSITSLDGEHAVVYVDKLDGERSVVMRIVDAGVPGPPIKVNDSDTNTNLWMTAVTHDGDAYGVAWHDSHEVYFRMVSAAGVTGDKLKQLTNDPYFLQPPAIAYGEGAFSVVWSDIRDDEDIFMVRVTRDLEKLWGPKMLDSAPGTAHHPEVCFDGEWFSLLWIDPRAGADLMTLATVNGTGEFGLAPIVLPTSGSPLRARMICDSRGYTLAWLQGDDVMAARVDREGNWIAEPTLVSTPGAICSNFSLARGDDAYLVASVEQILGQGVDGTWVLQPAQLVVRRFSTP